VAHAKYGGGSGTADAPYLISNANHMNAIGANQGDWNKHFKLTADIDLSGFVGSQFNMIGYYHSYYNKKAFTGVFDGNGHTISNFTYNSDSEDKFGIFVYIHGSGQVRNLGMLYPNVVYTGTSRYCLTSSLVTYMRGGSVENCWIKGGSVSGRDDVGALVGYIYAGQVTRCWAESVEVRGRECVGGLVGGTDWDATVSGCYANCDVQGGSLVGGCIGQNDGWALDSYAQGRVAGSSKVGGFMGSILEGETTRNCYSSAKVECAYGGGFSGPWGWGIVEACFWDIETSGQTTSADGIGLTTAQMQDANTFTEAGWDFNTPIWKMCRVTGYPKLWWQLCPLPAPILQPEPQVTLGTSNTISWEPVVGGIEYYAECSTESNFVNIYNSDWITDNNCTFWDMNLWQKYWYRVKAKSPKCTRIWLQTYQAHFENDMLHNVSVGSVPGDVILAKGDFLDVDSVARAFYSSYSRRIIGNFFECHQNRLLLKIENYFRCSESYKLYFFVYEAMSKTGTYNLIHMNSAYARTGEGWSNSGDISVPLVADRYYCMGVAWEKENTVHFYFDRKYVTENISWGIKNGSMSSKSYPPPDTISFSGGSSKQCYTQRLTTQKELSGNIVSIPINLPTGGDWGKLKFSATTPLGTGLTVDVLDAADGNVIVADVNSGIDLSAIAVTSIKLQANLSTDDLSITPSLHDWVITYTDPTTIRESGFSNVESSMQGTLLDAVDIMLDPNSLKNENAKNALLNKIDAALNMIEEANYIGALNKLQNDILTKTNGCADMGQPDKNDWIITCEQQNEIYPLIIETIEHVKALMAE
jgi:hypothetical protein